MSEPGPPAEARMGWAGRLTLLLPLAVVVGVPAGLVVAAFTAPRNWPPGWCGIPFAAVAVLLTGLNWGVALRPWFHRRRHGSLDGFRRSSGAPLVGNLFAVVGAAIGWGDGWAAALAVFAVAFDPGGLPWFVGVMIRTRQF